MVGRSAGWLACLLACLLVLFVCVLLDICAYCLSMQLRTWVCIIIYIYIYVTQLYVYIYTYINRCVSRALGLCGCVVASACAFCVSVCLCRRPNGLGHSRRARARSLWHGASSRWLQIWFWLLAGFWGSEQEPMRRKRAKFGGVHAVKRCSCPDLKLRSERSASSRLRGLIGRTDPHESASFQIGRHCSASFRSW